MDTFLNALSTWLHALATIVMIGYYLFTCLIFLPIFEGQVQGTALREMLELVSNRLRPYFGGSLLIFLITGTYLMMINEKYLGLGQFFGNTWSILIVIKHVVVLAFLALAIYSERVFLGRIRDGNPRGLTQYRRALNITLYLGLFILLLTSIAQAA
jgi:uncharacterized membrane protein